MATDTKTPNLVINTLTQEQFDGIENPSDTELYLTPDTTSEEIANAVSAHNTSTTAHNDIRTELSGKQDELTAGDNITIAEDTETGNLVISAASGTEYTPGLGIDISEDNEISLENFGRVANKLYGTSHLADPAMIGAGDNITIDRFTISAKDTTYLAGENITITSGSEIAPGYTRVDYVEASGVAFIDTGTKMTANSVLTFVGKGSHTYTGGASGSMLGVCSSNYRNTIAIRTSGTNEVGWTIGSAGYSNHSDLEMETVVINLPESKAYFNGTAFNITSITPEDYNTYLFATNAGGSYYKLGYGRFLSFKQEDNGVKTCEFVACVRQSDNRPGVYETVSGRFLTCSGLTAGPASGEDEYYINASSGTTYTAGTGIDITNNEISVDTDVVQEKLTEGTGIDITDNEISAVKGEWEWKGKATSSITFGNNTETTTAYSGTVLIGYSNNIGYNTTDTVTYNVILGYNNSTYGAEDGIMIGRYNLANGQKIVCIGKDNAVGGTNVIAIGNGIDNGTVDVQSSIMIGDSVKALANNTVAIGLADKAGTPEVLTQATKSGSIAIGRAAQATNLNAIAIGRHATSSSGNSVAIGSYVTATGMSSLAIGAGASNTQIISSAQNSIAIGNGSQATNTYSISLGYDSKATQAQSVALGYSATSTGHASVVVGSSTASNPASVAIGAGATAGADYAISIGVNSSATASSSIAMGDGANAASGISIGKGSYVKSSALFGVAIGNDAKVEPNGAGSVALGQNAQVLGSGAVQLGGGSNQINGSLQFRSYQLVNSSGYIPADRLGQSAQQGRVLCDISGVGQWVDIMFALSGQEESAGKFLTTNGDFAYWKDIDIPKPTYNAATKTISF